MSSRTVIVAVARPGRTSTSTMPAAADALSPPSIASALRRAISSGSVNGCTPPSLGCVGERHVVRRVDPLVLRRRPGRGSVAERPTAELLAVVRRGPAGQVRALGDDLRGIDVLVHDVVVPLDVLEVHGVAEA